MNAPINHREDFMRMIKESGAPESVQSVCISAFDAGYTVGLQEGIRLSAEIGKMMDDLLKGGK